MKRLLHNPLGAMLWKEVRENAVWAVLGALIFIAINYAVIVDFMSRSHPVYYYSSNVIRQFINGWREPVITLGIGPALATVLGIMQVLPERRRDQWAFLVHRPLSHATVFWYKTVAGSLLYFLSLGGAFLFLWYLKWAPINRLVPVLPFDWHFLLGGIANLLLGVPFYFAAILCVMRPVRWYGSKVLPLAGCVCLLYLSAGLEEFYQYFWLAVIYSVVFALAGRSSFVDQGQSSSQNKAGRLALGLALLSGLAPLLAVALLTLNVWASVIFPLRQTTMDIAREPKIVSTQYGLLPKGKIIRVIYGSDSKTKYVGTDGKENNVRGRDLRFLSAGVSRNERRFFQVSSRYLCFLDYSFESGIYSERLGRILFFDNNWKFVGYSSATDSGLNAKAQRKLLAEVGGGFLWFTGGVYRLEPSQKVLRPVTKATDIEKVAWHSIREEQAVGAPDSPAPVETINKVVKAWLATVRASAIDFYDENGNRLFSTLREHDRNVYSRVSTAKNLEGDRYYVCYTPGFGVPEVQRRRLPDYLVTFDGKGRVLKRNTFPPLSGNSSYPMETRKLYGLGLSLPLAGLAGYSASLLREAVTYGLAPGLWLSELTLRLPDIFALAILSFVCAIVCCIVLYLLRRRSGLTKRSLIAWMVTVFLLGPVGLLLFLAMRGWPSRVPCPDCGKPRAANFNYCENCGASWPVRVKDGTEILPGGQEAPAPH